MARHEEFQSEVLLRAEDTGGVISAVLLTVPGGWEGPPLHHHDFDEAFYVLEGEPTFQLDTDLSTATAGELVFAPRGAHHTLANLGENPARYLLICTPAGFERYFDKVAARMAGVDPPPSALEPIPEVITVGPQIGKDAGP